MMYSDIGASLRWTAPVPLPWVVEQASKHRRPHWADVWVAEFDDRSHGWSWCVHGATWTQGGDHRHKGGWSGTTPVRFDDVPSVVIEHWGVAMMDRLAVLVGHAAEVATWVKTDLAAHALRGQGAVKIEP